MSLDKPISDEATLVAGVLVILVGSVALWTNPKRILNRLFFSISIHVTLWLSLLYLALTADSGLPWMRACCSVAGLLPLHLLFLREAVAGSRGQALEKTILGWVVVCVVMSIMPMTVLFVPETSSREYKIFGPGYYLFIAMQMAAYSELCRGSIAKARTLSGIARIELHILLLGGCITGGVILSLMLLGVMTGVRTLIHAQPLVILLFYSLTVLAITTHRVFEPSYLLQAALRRMTLVAIVSAIGYICDQGISLMIDEPFGFLVTTGVILLIAQKLDKSLILVFGSNSQFTRVTKQVLDAAEPYLGLRELASRYERILEQYLGTAVVMIDYAVRSGKCELATIRIREKELAGIKSMGWVTQERLARERETAVSREVSTLLERNKTNAFIYKIGSTLDVLIGLGERQSRRPYVYHEIKEIMDLAEKIEGVLARLYLTAKAQTAERLAAAGIFGAGVAHEIRNPLVSIKTFVQLLPSHYSDAGFRTRFFALISDEVARIEGLTEQLMNLASPRKPEVRIYSLREMISEVMPLVECKAVERGVSIELALVGGDDDIAIDANSFRQVLINLCQNAIQAQEQGEKAEKWIEISTSRGDRGMLLLVRDNGPGIRLEDRGRLFEVFHTTKSNGFGLGLALSSSILREQGAELTIDPFIEGEGAAFRVLFPWKASS